MNGDSTNINDPSTSGDGFSSRKQTLAIRLQQRRPRQVLADQGIIPPLNQPGVYYEQVQRLERAIKEDYLNKAIQERPDRKYLVEKHILEDTAVSSTIVASQKNLKKAKLVDDLNEKILLRPGVIELVEKNIIPSDKVQEAIKGGQIQYKKIADFVDEDSSDQFSPEQPLPPASSPPLTNFKISEQQPQQIPTSSNSEKIYVPNKSKASIGKTSSSSSIFTQSSAHPYLSRLPSKGTSKSGNLFSTSSSSSSLTSSSSSSSHVARSSRKNKKERQKLRVYKYHEYKPRDQQGKSQKQPVMNVDTPYQRLLQQQQIYLSYEIMHTQYHNNAQRSGVDTGASSSGASGSFNQQSMNGGQQQSQSSSVIKLECRAPNHHSVVAAGNKQQQVRSKLTTTKLEEMKVSELKEELKARSLKVTGTKEVLIERLRPHCVQIETPGLFSLSDLQLQQRKSQISGRVNGDDKISAQQQQQQQQTKFDISLINDQKVKEHPMMILSNSNNAGTAKISTASDNHSNKTSVNSSGTNGDMVTSNGGGDLFRSKLSRMPQAEAVKLVPKQEKLYQLPTWNANLSEGQLIINSNMLAQHPTLVQQQQQQQQQAPSSDISNDMKDKMLIIQQKEIHDLKKQLHELNKSKELAKMEAHTSNGNSNPVQRLPLRNSDDQFIVFSNNGNNNHQLATATVNDETFEMMDQQQATSSNSNQTIEEMFDLVHSDVHSAVGSNNSINQQQMLTNNESSAFPPNMCVIDNKPPSGCCASNNEGSTDDDLMAGLHNLIHSHHKDNLLGGGSSGGCMHDTTKILLETSGDALMDTSNFPIKMAPHSHHHHHHLYSPPRPSTCTSAESSLGGGGGGITFSNGGGERIRLSTSSLDGCNNQQQHNNNSSFFSTSKMFTTANNNNSNRQQHNALIKSSSHEFLSVDNHPHHSSNHSSPLMSTSHHHQQQHQQQRSDDFLLHNHPISSSSNEGGSGGDLSLSLANHHHHSNAADQSQQLGWLDLPLLSGAAAAASSHQQTNIMSSASPLPLDDVGLLAAATSSSSNHNHHDGADLFDDFSVDIGGGGKSDDVDMLASNHTCIAPDRVTSAMMTSSSSQSPMNSVSTSLFGGSDMPAWPLGGGGGSSDWESILGLNQPANDFTT